MRIKIIALLIALLVISMLLTKLNLSAQEDSPSLSVTVQFLIDNAEFIHDLGNNGGREWRLENPDDCTLVWTTEADKTIHSTGNAYIDSLRRKTVALPTTVTLSLSDINNVWTSSLPVRNSNVGRPDYQTIHLSVTHGRRVVKWRGGDYDHDEDNLTLRIKSSEMGERYLKALRNAVRLCEKPDREEPNNINALPINSSTPTAR